LARVVDLLDQHATDLSAFFDSDPKGKQLPVFLNLLSKNLAEERTEIASELEQLTAKVEHIKTIVVTQQSYAGVSGVLEDVDLRTMLDDAIKFNATSFERHHIKIVRKYASLPKVRLDKQKVLQILVNLLKNAREAFHDCPNDKNRQVIVRTMVTDKQRLQIRIIDNAVGIPAEDLTRIFSHGFTTKTSGHGFGLHSCANAAKEMKGTLSVHSEGRGRGATFILELPFEPLEKLVQT
jgi:signal transduction histidine kinase